MPLIAIMKVRFSVIEVCQRARSLAEAMVAKLDGKTKSRWLRFRSVGLD